MPFVAPTLNGGAFNCPICNAYANMAWAIAYRQDNNSWIDTGVRSARCAHCHQLSFWLTATKIMILPATVTAPLAHPDMPAEALSDYNEAREISARSPRAAAALLRLVIQRICIKLGEPGKNLNDDIGSLVRKGLALEIQQALDVVRVIGNNAIHPGELSDSDVADVSNALFELINHIVEDRIAKPKKLKTLFEKLPEGARKAIEKRDGGK